MSELPHTMKNNRNAIKLSYALALLFLAGCGDYKSKKAGEKFASIQAGMGRDEVEKILGKPIGIQNGQNVFYIRPNPGKKYESTYSHAQIEITYSLTNTVVEKRFIGK